VEKQSQSLCIAFADDSARWFALQSPTPFLRQRNSRKNIEACLPRLKRRTAGLQTLDLLRTGAAIELARPAGNQFFSISSALIPIRASRISFAA